MSKITMTARYAVEVQPFQSTEETRYYLNGFCVDHNPAGGVRIVATDGHRLVCFHDTDGTLTGEKLIIQLDKSQLAAIKGALKDWRMLAANAVSLVIENDSNPKGTLQIRVGADDKEPGKLIASFSDVIVDGTFPDYERVVPNEYQTFDKPKEPGAERLPFDKLAPFSFNSSYLADFGKLSTNPKLPVVDVVRVADHMSPHLVFISGRSDVFGVLMPVRGDVNKGVPDWYRQPATKAAATQAAAE